MARAFSIDFQYKEEIYTAVITITSSDTEKLISVYVPETELHRILPNGKVTLCSMEVTQEDTSLTEPVQDLLKSILISVKAHEEKMPSVGLW